MIQIESYYCFVFASIFFPTEHAVISVECKQSKEWVFCVDLVGAVVCFGDFEVDCYFGRWWSCFCGSTSKHELRFTSTELFAVEHLMNGTDSFINHCFSLSRAITFQNRTLLAAKADLTNFIFRDDHKIHLILLTIKHNHCIKWYLWLTNLITFIINKFLPCLWTFQLTFGPH